MLTSFDNSHHYSLGGNKSKQKKLKKNNFKGRLEKKLQHRKEQNLLRNLNTLTSQQDTEITINGHHLINFCSNDYLGLAKHPDIIAMFKVGADQFGVGSSASSLVCGRSYLHQQLEEKLAKKTGRQAALIFSSGYMANLAVVATLLGRTDDVFLDRLAHASLVDAARLSGSTLHRYQHVNSEALALVLERSLAKEKMVLTDAVFSMDGDKAPLAELVRVCKQHDATLLVDDAHGFAVLGNSGGGLLEEQGIQTEDVPIFVATFGKALGTVGAFVAADKIIIETLIQFARTYIYTTALAPAIVGATLASLDLLEKESWRREKLNTLIKHFRSGAVELGLHLLASETAIQPLIIGDNKRAVDISDKLFNAGFLIPAIRSPTVPKGSARLRITLTATHSKAQVDGLLEVLGRSL